MHPSGEPDETRGWAEPAATPADQAVDKPGWVAAVPGVARPADAAPSGPAENDPRSAAEEPAPVPRPAAGRPGPPPTAEPLPPPAEPSPPSWVDSLAARAGAGVANGRGAHRAPTGAWPEVTPRYRPLSWHANPGSDQAAVPSRPQPGGPAEPPVPGPTFAGAPVEAAPAAAPEPRIPDAGFLGGADAYVGDAPAAGVGTVRADLGAGDPGDVTLGADLPRRVPSEPSDVIGRSDLARIATYLRDDAGPRTAAESFDVAAVLAAVRLVDGVRGAELRTGPAGARKLRLDIADGADPERVGREVAGLLKDRLGLAADPLPQSTPRPEPQPAVPRVRLEQVQVTTAGLEAAVETALSYGGVRTAGRCAGPAVDGHVLRAAAVATAAAVDDLLAGRGRCAVEHADIIPAGQIRVAVVVVLMLTRSGPEQFAGVAPVTGDRCEAIARATLSALNRRVGALLAR